MIKVIKIGGNIVDNPLLLKDFVKDCEQIQNAYIEKLNGDVSWFCKKFDYRYDEEPWYDSKDAVERSMKFLRSDIHRNVK